MHSQDQNSEQMISKILNTIILVNEIIIFPASVQGNSVVHSYNGQGHKSNKLWKEINISHALLICLPNKVLPSCSCSASKISWHEISLSS